ncbi:hypothetical protein SUGI_0813890 [Cryptomeria japonica]|uniref:uncharacterized protein LOC131048428 n=1 Tax=Cryptomeria japonica TaxID=3369 RepID=UPI002414A763|nr:uncharacterized protein LOC131048428 [Cryptomeria japonica]GLJ39818.1 hypothetical protein SUGI_0813890 [Cryptomeria japonica]
MASPKVQHVPKDASDKLLVKFSDVSVYDYVYNQSGVPSPEAKKNGLKKRMGAVTEGIRTQNPKHTKNNSNNSVSASRELESIVTWKTPLNGNSAVRKTGLLRSVGSLKSSHRTVAQIKTYALFSTAAGKAWQKALRGASKFLMDKRAVQPVRLRKELL